MTPFGVRYRKEIEENKKRQLQPISIAIGEIVNAQIHATDIETHNAITTQPEQKTQSTAKNKVEYANVNECLFRFEPLQLIQSNHVKETSNPRWECWIRSNTLCFMVKQSI